MLIYTFNKDKKDELLNLNCKLKQELKYDDRVAYVFQVDGNVYKKYQEDNSIFMFNKMTFA